MSRVDRIILGSLAVTAAALAVIVAIATAKMPEAQPRPADVIVEAPVTTTTPPTTDIDAWLACYHDPDTEQWVANLPTPAPGECR